MKVIVKAGNGWKLETIDLATILDWIFNRPSAPCVVCGVNTRQIYYNSASGQHEHVHDLDDPDFVGCKYVWRYWRDKPTRETDERDYYDDYQSYISSREWEIKSFHTKAKAGWRCEQCKRPGKKNRLHLHHKHYKTLFRERRCDVEVLCDNCHKKRHNL
jgi:hypothetical protein